MSLESGHGPDGMTAADDIACIGDKVTQSQSCSSFVLVLGTEISVDLGRNLLDDEDGDTSISARKTP